MPNFFVTQSFLHQCHAWSVTSVMSDSLPWPKWLLTHGTGLEVIVPYHTVNREEGKKKGREGEAGKKEGKKEGGNFKKD